MRSKLVSVIRPGLALALVGALGLLASAASAQQRIAPAGRDATRVRPDAAGALAGARQRPPSPPPAALEACRGLTSNAVCSVSGPRGERIAGHCRAPEGAPLACAPDHRPPGPPPPPREALEACRSQRAGAACAFPGREGERVTGRCESPPGLPLACRPDHPPPPPPEALAACEDTAAGDACIVETPRGAIEGTCRELREGPSACVPNDAPPPPPREAP